MPSPLDLGLSSGDVRYCWPMSFTARTGAYSAYIAGTEGFESSCNMYRVTTDDPGRWNESPQEVLEPTIPGLDWDAQGAVSNSVVEFDGVHYMFYVGFGNWSQQGSIRFTRNHYLGLAVSEDGGDTWERWSDVQLPVHTTAEGEINMVAARRIGSRIHLWIEDSYEGETGIGYFLFHPDEL